MTPQRKQLDPRAWQSCNNNVICGNPFIDAVCVIVKYVSLRKHIVQNILRTKQLAKIYNVQIALTRFYLELEWGTTAYIQVCIMYVLSSLYVLHFSSYFSEL